MKSFTRAFALLAVLFGVGLLAGRWAIDLRKPNNHPRDNATTPQAGQSEESRVAVGSSAHSATAQVPDRSVAEHSPAKATGSVQAGPEESRGVTDKITDEEAKDLAYRAASDEQQALQTLQNGVLALGQRICGGRKQTVDERRRIEAGIA